MQKFHAEVGSTNRITLYEGAEFSEICRYGGLKKDRATLLLLAKSRIFYALRIREQTVKKC